MVSNDVLAAIIGGLALILVATIPLLWKRLGAVSKRTDFQEIREYLIEIKALLRNHREEKQ